MTNSKRLHSFHPFVDSKSKIIILGTMPGPEALRKKEYYGFSGNHFWKIMADLFNKGKQLRDYSEKISLLQKNHIALWDVYSQCERATAADGAIRNGRLNNIPRLLTKHPHIRRVFVNGCTAERIYNKHFLPLTGLRATLLPSTSPAHASLSYPRKLALWKSAFTGVFSGPSNVSPRTWSGLKPASHNPRIPPNRF